MKRFDKDYTPDGDIMIESEKKRGGEYVKYEAAQKLMEAVKFAYLISDDEHIEKICGDALEYANKN